MKWLALTVCCAAWCSCRAPVDTSDDDGRAPVGGVCDADDGKDACVPGAFCDDARCVPLPACGARCGEYNTATGLQSCDGDSYENRRPPAGCFPTERLDDSAGCGDGEACPSGFDCVPTGYSEGGEGEAGRMGCVQACTNDADCGDEMACLCGNTRENGSVSLRVNECVPAACRSDDDCGGNACGIARSPCNQEVSLHCRTETDSCFLRQVEGQCAVCLFLGDHFEGFEYSNCD